jgi:hypothetical protein
MDDQSDQAGERYGNLRPGQAGKTTWRELPQFCLEDFALVASRESIWPADQSLSAASALRLSRSTGLMEKNLLRHGAQRSAGMRNIRGTMDLTPETYSGAIRCNPKFPQILQRA